MTAGDRPVGRDELGALTKIGEGGQGKVYRTERFDGVLYKEYLDPSRCDVEELERLIRRVRDDPMPEGDRELLLASTAWPTAVVAHEGRFSGMLMSEAPERFTGVIGGQPGLRELQYLTHPPKLKWSDLDLPDRDGRLAIARAYARLFRALHDRDIVIGDVSSKNFLWSHAPDAAVYALDCDGFSVNGYRPPMEPAQTPDWIDPDPRSGPASFESDRYKLALIAVRVLLVRKQATPAEVASDREAMDALGDRIGDLVRRVADGERCGAEAWIGAFDGRPTLRLDRPAPRSEECDPPERPTIRF
ncbi:hypothetical protein [Glycomyces xiaoerkulensis]|uniref:hypothetical protein n=1 Tax=Glycomyces xiaoerkulensis TaxID=2038139 RepID=UPI0012FFF314|nr:hypothetical protein [Glycomyces xiaoerkulensis]